MSKSDDFAIGMERYQQFWRKHSTLPADALERDRFFCVHPGDTWYASLDQFPAHYEQLSKKWDAARYVGDKVPRFWQDLPALLRRFPQARVIFTYRDPFAVARSYKVRSANPDDPVWGKGRDASFGVLEWNESLKKLVDFFNAGQPEHGAASEVCFVLKYEQLVTNSFDRRALGTFLGYDEALPISGAWGYGKASGKVENLSESEKELLWSLLDLRLIAEIGKIISGQHAELGRRIALSNYDRRREWYHTSDKQVCGIDYGEYRVTGCSYVFRGRREPLDAFAPFAACLGSATTFGRFLAEPYPELLAGQTKMPVLNLGIGGARPECYLTNVAVMSLLRRARLVIIELMSARGYPSPIFAPLGYEANFGLFMDWFGLKRFRHDDAALDALLKKSENGQPVFVDEVYRIVVPHLDGDQRDLVRDAILSHYTRDYLQLRKEIGRPVLGLLMTSGEPLAARSRREVAGYNEWSGGYPHFVDDIVVKHLRQQGIPVLVSRSRRGVPFTVRNPLTREPVPVFASHKDPTMNTYYPSQEMHDDAAEALLQHPMVRLHLGRAKDAA